jgi:transcriptional regulator with XRE-family HTH domain
VSPRKKAVIIDRSDLCLRFGENLKRSRRLADLSQEELGRRASLHRTQIGNLENGLRTPRLDTIVKLAGGLEIAPGDLLVRMAWWPGRPSEFGSFDLAIGSGPLRRPDLQQRIR